MMQSLIHPYIHTYIHMHSLAYLPQGLQGRIRSNLILPHYMRISQSCNTTKRFPRQDPTTMLDYLTPLPISPYAEPSVETVKAESPFMHSQLFFIHVYHTESFFLVLQTSFLHLTSSLHSHSIPFVDVLSTTYISYIYLLSPTVPPSLSPNAQTISTPFVLLDELSQHKFSFTLPVFSFSSYVLLSTYSSSHTEKPLHSISSPLLLTSSHTTQSVQLLPHTTFYFH